MPKAENPALRHGPVQCNAWSCIVFFSSQKASTEICQNATQQTVPFFYFCGFHKQHSQSKECHKNVANHRWHDTGTLHWYAETVCALLSGHNNNNNQIYIVSYGHNVTDT